MSDIARDIATAVNGHLKALRLLKRSETTCADVAVALGLPEKIVERVFSQFKIRGAMLSDRKVAKVAPSSRVISLRHNGRYESSLRR